MRARWMDLSFMVLALAVVGSVSYAGARLTWHKMGETGAQVPPPVAAVALPEPLDITPILDFAPFGEAVPEPEAVAAAPVSKPANVLSGFRLTGVILAEPAEFSLAMISDPTGEVTGYRIGEELAKDAVLKSVHREHVMISVAGKSASLRFEGEPQIIASGVDRLRELIVSRPDAYRDRSIDMAIPRGLAPAGSTPEAAIDHYRRRITANPRAVMDDLGLTLAENGYRIGPDAPAAVLRAGLKRGDVVTKVNGEEVGVIERDRHLFDDIAASGRARVEILRDGRTITLSFPLR